MITDDDVVKDDEVVLSRRSGLIDKIGKSVRVFDLWICEKYIKPQHHIIEEQICKCCHKISLAKTSNASHAGKSSISHYFRNQNCFIVSSAPVLLVD
jgi:hypothetical protein